MKDIFKKYIINLSLLFSLAVVLLVSANMNWGDERWKGILRTDGIGYYAYLPAIFIYNDLSFDYYDELVTKNDYENLDYGFIRPWAGKNVNKYFVGTSVALMPFFGLGHLAAITTGDVTNGYTKWYLIFLQLGAVFYCFLGLFFMQKILKIYAISDSIIALVILAVIFGTNLFYYTVYEPSISHVYSFAFVNIFVFSFLKFFKKPRTLYLLAGLISLSMILLTRPVNGLIILSLFFIAGRFEYLKSGIQYLFKRPMLLLTGVLLTVGILSIQLIIYKIQTGSYFVYSYEGEGFNFSSFHLDDFLFSYRKGYFLYTPIAFLSLIGFYKLFQKSKYQAVSLSLFLLIVVYILSSWWMWYYGGSFSQRVMVEYLVFFSIPLALLLEKSSWRKIWVSLTIILILGCQVQTFQYKKGYIHWSEMNKERYWDHFLRLDKVINKAEKDW